MLECGKYKPCEKLFPLKTISQFLKNKKKLNCKLYLKNNMKNEFKKRS